MIFTSLISQLCFVPLFYTPDSPSRSGPPMEPFLYISKARFSLCVYVLQ